METSFLTGRRTLDSPNVHALRVGRSQGNVARPMAVVAAAALCGVPVRPVRDAEFEPGDPWACGRCRHLAAVDRAGE